MKFSELFASPRDLPPADREPEAIARAGREEFDRRIADWHRLVDEAEPAADEPRPASR